MQCRKFKPKKDFFGHGSIFSLSKIIFTDSKGKPKKFSNFYPEADVSEIEYAILCTQDCDIEQKKVTHLNVALLEPIQRSKKENPLKFLELDFKNLVVPFETVNFYTQSDIQKKLRTEIERLIDNNNSHYLFVDIKGKFYFINLSKIFPLKFEHFDAIKKKAKFQLEGSFKHLLGWKLAYLYGRVGVDNYQSIQKEELLRKIISLVGESVRTLWPENSFELSEEQLKLLKNDLAVYEANKKRGKNLSEIVKKIDTRLEEFNFVKKTT